MRGDVLPGRREEAALKKRSRGERGYVASNEVASSLAMTAEITG
jgi:hypothetical protein